jgi:hypothetical protein
VVGLATTDGRRRRPVRFSGTPHQPVRRRMIPVWAFSIRPAVPVYCRCTPDGADALVQVAGLIHDQHRVIVGQVPGHVAAQIAADRLSVPHSTRQQTLHPVRTVITGVLGDRPAVRARQPSRPATNAAARRRGSTGRPLHRPHQTNPATPPGGHRAAPGLQLTTGGPPGRAPCRRTRSSEPQTHRWRSHSPAATQGAPPGVGQHRPPTAYNEVARGHTPTPVTRSDEPRRTGTPSKVDQRPASAEMRAVDLDSIDHVDVRPSEPLQALPSRWSR